MKPRRDSMSVSQKGQTNVAFESLKKCSSFSHGWLSRGRLSVTLVVFQGTRNHYDHSLSVCQDFEGWWIPCTCSLFMPAFGFSSWSIWPTCKNWIGRKCSITASVTCLMCTSMPCSSLLQWDGNLQEYMSALFIAKVERKKLLLSWGSRHWISGWMSALEDVFSLL